MISSLRRIGMGLLVCLFTVPASAQSDTARPLLARSLAALDHGNASAARALATQAVAADPRWGLAHAVAARSALAQGDAIAAEAELARARDAGLDPTRTRQLSAEARLLMGDPQAALAIAKTVAPRYWTYGLRIQARALAAMGNPGAADEILRDAVGRSPGDARAWTDLGRLRRSVGDTIGAIAAATQAMALDADDTDALLLRAQLVRQQFGLAAALPWLEGALQRDPARYDVLIDYAATLGDLGRTQDMLAATRRALAARPGDGRALYSLAVLAARAGNDDLARTLLGRAGGDAAALPGALMLGAVLDIGDADYEQAVTRLRELVGRQPMNIRARQLLGRALVGAGSPRDALAVLAPVVARNDADSYSLTLVARAQEALGDRVEAARLLDRAVWPQRAGSASFSADDGVASLAAADAGSTPGAPGTALPLIRALLDRGDTAQALARAQGVAAANPGAAPAHVVLGDTLMTLGRAGDAVLAYRRAATIAFDEPTMLRLTEALDLSGQHREAAEALALFLAQNPANVAALRLAAHRQIAGGDHDAAIDTLEGLRARLGDRDAALLAELAHACDRAGDGGRAARYAAAAYALAPSLPAAADAYGWSLFGGGDAGGALQLLQKAVAVAPAKPQPRWHLAQLYAQLGRKGDARFQAMAALSDPRFADRDAAQQLVASLG